MIPIEKAFALFDQYNQGDPTRIVWSGQEFPETYFYALRLYDWVKRLDANAAEALLLASRCQHIGRWEIPRATYPDGRAGYLRWRADLAKYHAAKATELLRIAGYDEATCNDVTSIILKKQLKLNPDVQTIENALCLVFLEFQYDDLIEKQGREKMIPILQKTWAKMSEPGKAAALQLNYSPEGKSLIAEALG